ncbi:PilW family protein [Chitinimonas koreensis]|uniref:PilW family protein n=1 Tax=Chitinimonas koreensis TaxID=356302 RepID=UPI0003F64AF7|nr:PilW family protein [Chitinimonas koreensis]QNM95277.1 PilW family protein [Chitinimonas koreensis]
MAYRKQTGFTLIELMISVVIALVVLLGVSNLYLGTRQTNKIQTMQSRLSEDGRFAVSMLQRMIGQAGYRNSPNLAVNANRLTPGTGSASTTSATVQFTADGNNQIGCPGTVAAAGAYTAVINFAANALTCTAGGTSTSWLAGAGSGAGGSSDVVDFRLQYGVDANDAVPATPADYGCGATAANPTLRVRDCIADSYVSALTGGQTSDQIVSVRACIVLRSEQSDSRVVKRAAYNNCSGTAIANSQNDGRLYRTFNTTVLIKNF